MSSTGRCALHCPNGHFVAVASALAAAVVVVVVVDVVAVAVVVVVVVVVEQVLSLERVQWKSVCWQARN